MIQFTLAVTISLLVGCTTKSTSGSKDGVASNSAIKESGTESTDAQEWKGICRQALPETAKKKKTNSPNRLQSSYSFKEKAVVWSVSSFADKDCKNVIEINRYSFTCDSSPLSSYANCVQQKWETGDGKTWKEKPMVDYAGTTNRLEMKYSLKVLKDNKATLKSIGESEEEESETLSHE
ncbi:MAG: hypothetical protein ACXWC9_01850 [Pseudobdellovibrionaceae bacterium]